MQPNRSDESAKKWMQVAFEEASEAAAMGEVPVGAVLVFENRLVARAHNLRESAQDPLAHAEILALRAAAKELGRWRLTGCTLVVTLEPCCMCAGAIVNSRIDRLIFGAKDAKAGAAGSLYNIVADDRLNHCVKVVDGVCQERASSMLSQFFAQRRLAKKSSRR